MMPLPSEALIWGQYTDTNIVLHEWKNGKAYTYSVLLPEFLRTQSVGSARVNSPDTFPGAGLISKEASCSGGFPSLPLQASDGAGDRLLLCFLRMGSAANIRGCTCGKITETCDPESEPKVLARNDASCVLCQAILKCSVLRDCLCKCPDAQHKVQLQHRRTSYSRSPPGMLSGLHGAVNRELPLEGFGIQLPRADAEASSAGLCSI